MGSVFGDIWDDARGIFNDVLDFKLAQQEFALAREVRAAEANRSFNQAPVIGGVDLGSVVPWLLILAAGGGLIYVLKK